MVILISLPGFTRPFCRSNSNSIRMAVVSECALIIFHASFSKRRANGRFTSHLGVISLSASYPTSLAVGTYSSRGRTYIYGRRNKKNGRVDFILYTQTDRFRTTKRCCCRCSCSFLLLYNTAQASSLCGLGAGHVTMVGSQSDDEDQPRPLGGSYVLYGDVIVWWIHLRVKKIKTQLNGYIEG